MTVPTAATGYRPTFVIDDDDDDDIVDETEGSFAGARVSSSFDDDDHHQYDHDDVRSNAVLLLENAALRSENASLKSEVKSLRARMSALERANARLSRAASASASTQTTAESPPPDHQTAGQTAGQPGAEEAPPLSPKESTGWQSHRRRSEESPRSVLSGALERLSSERSAGSGNSDNKKAHDADGIPINSADAADVAVDTVDMDRVRTALDEMDEAHRAESMHNASAHNDNNASATDSTSSDEASPRPRPTSSGGGTPVWQGPAGLLARGASWRESLTKAIAHNVEHVGKTLGERRTGIEEDPAAAAAKATDDDDETAPAPPSDADIAASASLSVSSSSASLQSEKLAPPDSNEAPPPSNHDSPPLSRRLSSLSDLADEAVIIPNPESSAASAERPQESIGDFTRAFLEHAVKVASMDEEADAARREREEADSRAAEALREEERRRKEEEETVTFC